MFNDFNFYKSDGFYENKGSINFCGVDIAAELKVNDKDVELRIFDFNRAIGSRLIDLESIRELVFFGENKYFKLFGLEFKSASSMRLGANNTFPDYVLKCGGFFYSRINLNNINKFSGFKFYSERITTWVGVTEKIGHILDNSFKSILPDDEDLLELEESAQGLGVVSISYEYAYGGLKNPNTVGMAITPHVALVFEEEFDLEVSLEKYKDLYMLLRFFIGGDIDLSEVEVLSPVSGFGNAIKLFHPEKKTDDINRNESFFIPYSNMMSDRGGKFFPRAIIRNYNDSNDRNVKSLLKKFIAYSMVSNYEEGFLGYYRIVEAATLKRSYYVDEETLASYLNRYNRVLSKLFPGVSISKFSRAIKRANSTKSNTEMCIRNYFKNKSMSLYEALFIDQLNLEKLCRLRNKMVHQPLYSVSVDEAYSSMRVAKILANIILLIELDVSFERIMELAHYQNWKVEISNYKK
ncbi:hypothetical protein QM574_08540 [Pantoea ananatis]|uniref:ApeA N-terminal domain 1-containing protein n=1 Tax=Pantoea ananas TaxID=553 RepID=UPI0024B7F006|nr:hypothetical protein [Pantoea ananatis]MDJ0044607.1 hypothetical protein [Pantoea ananatis]